MSKHLPLLAILWAYLLAGSLYAVYTPPWQAPDEPAHYNYIRQLADGRFPVMQNQDYDEAYRNAAVSSGFAAQYDITRLSYEDYQPPLYYLLQTPLFWLTGGHLVALRLMAVLLGAITLTLAYNVAQHVFQQRWLALTAVAFIAFLPQHVAIQASLNNDALSELLIAAMLAVLVRYHPHHQRENMHFRLLALLLGLGFLTKVTTYLMAPVIAVPLLWHNWPQVSSTIRKGLQQIALPAALLGSLWWVRNLTVYGWPDFLGIEAHDAAVVGQLLTKDYIAQQGVNNALQAFIY
ncbi:MAG: glycosyltransferase family 39 protein, partial [Anaerolineales bacterium]|nr:glycosyltransferase family 39 protein [Anaerolineales bacterium]